MTSRIATLALRVLVPALGLVAVACGDSAVSVPQASAAALLAGNISVKQTGDAPVTLAGNSATWKLDDAKLVTVTITVHSSAKTAVTLSARGSLYDKDGKPVGDVTGGQLGVQPNSDAQLKLTGPTPNGTVTAATFEFTTIPSATPIPGGA
jgi:hypothetical protein